MVNSNKLLLEEIQKFITHIAGLPVCDYKLTAMEKLLDLEWDLRHKIDEEENNLPSDDFIIEDPFYSNEEPWSE